MVKNPPASAGDIRDLGSIPGYGGYPGGGYGSPLQYSCLENPKDRGVWQATVHRVTNSQTRLKQLSTLCFAGTVFFTNSRFSETLCGASLSSVIFPTDVFSLHVSLLHFGNS